MTNSNDVKTSWDSVMDETQNPLKNHSLSTAHMLMQMLAWMWSAIFSVWVGSYLAFGVSAVGHTLFVGGLFITIMVFKTAEHRNATRLSPRYLTFAVSVNHLT